MEDLSKDIDRLARENEGIQKQIDQAAQHKRELAERNKTLNDGLRA